MKRAVLLAVVLLTGCSSVAAATVHHKYRAKPTPKPIAFTVLVRRLSEICAAIPGGRYMLSSVATEPADSGPYFVCEGQGEKYVSIDITPEMLKP